MADNNSGNRPHASAPETINLELVIKQMGTTHVDVMYFGYNEVKRRGDDAVQLEYLQTEIRALHPRLDVTSSAATDELRKVLRLWRPNLDTTGRFTIQLSGELSLPDAENAEIERLREIEADLQRQLAELKKTLARIKIDNEKAIAGVSNDRNTAERELRAARSQVSALQGQLDTLKAAQAHGGQGGANSGPQDSQLFAEVTRLQLQLDAALRQLKELEHGQAQTPWGAASSHGQPQPSSNTPGPGGVPQPTVGPSAYDDYPPIPKPGKPIDDYPPIAKPGGTPLAD